MRAPSDSLPAAPVFELRAARYILLGFLFVIALPYLIAPLILPAGTVWGGLLGSADDQNVHLMWARQAKDGAFFFRDLYTTEGLTSGDKALFFNILPFVMGLLARITTLDVVFPYHFLRVALAGWALWQFHELALAVTNRDEKWSRARLLALFLLAFSTGAGILAPLPKFSGFFFIDRADGSVALMPEAYFLLSALAYPLNIASFGLLALVFRKVLEQKGAGVACVAALLLSNIHTYDALPLLVTLAVWLAWKRQGVKVGLAAIMGALLPVLYQVIVFRGSEEFRVKALTITAPPPLPSMLLAFAPLLVLAVLGIRKWKDLPALPLLLIWIASTFLLVYAPTSLFSFARKMIEGVQLPLVILAGMGLNELLSRIAEVPKRKILAGVVLGVLALSPLQYLGWLWNNTLENNASRAQYLMPPLAISIGDAGALQNLNNLSPRTGAGGQGASKGVVLCLPYLGSYVPRATGQFTFVGHWAETLYFKEEDAKPLHPAKFPQVARFYQGQMSPDEARAFLKDNHINWIIEGQYERAAANGVSMARNLGLKEVWTGGDAQDGPSTIYAAP